MVWDLTIVIPVCNEEKTLRQTAVEIVKTLSDSDLSFGILCVDDGSKDSSWEVIEKLERELPRKIQKLKLSRNFGKDAAILAGLEHTNSELVITMDADGQHPPKYLPKFIQLWKKSGCNVINGIKRSRQHDSLLQRAFAYAFNFIMEKVAGLDLHNASDFKFLDRKAKEAIIACEDRTIFFRGLVAWIGFNQQKIQFDVERRSRGLSQWGLQVLFFYAIDAIVLFSHFPVYFILALGGIAVLVCFVLLVILGFALTEGNVPSGYSTLIVLLLMNLGFSMLAIGGIGLYVKHSLEQTMRRPRYVIDTNFKKSNDRDIEN